MKRKLCMAAISAALLMTACSNKSVDLLANPADAETETTLASSQDTKSNQIEETADSESASAIFEDRTDSEEEGVIQEADASVGTDSDVTVNSDAQESLPPLPTEIPTEEGNLTAEEGVAAEPTKAPAINPTKSPEEEKPTVTAEPTAAVKPTQTPNPTVTAKPTQTPKPTVAAKPTQTPKPTVAVKPTQAPKPTSAVRPTAVPTSKPEDTTGSISSEASIQVKGQSISIGESKSSLVSKLGSPNRTDVTEFNYSYYVYNSSYTKFVMVAVANDKVVGWYTDSNDFSYCGLTTNSTVSNINTKFGTSKSLAKTISITANGQKITFFMDTLGNGTIDGIYVASSSVSSTGTTSAVLTAWEKEVLDLTNSFRARNGLSALSWSDQAGQSARKHSEDMAANGYFSHTGLNGSTPYDRMEAEGISYRAAGENIIGGYGNALYSVNGWVNSSGHRSNMLSTSFTNLGAGYALGGSYGNYCTQNFFR